MFHNANDIRVFHRKYTFILTYFASIYKLEGQLDVYTFICHTSALALNANSIDYK